MVLSDLAVPNEVHVAITNRAFCVESDDFTRMWRLLQRDYAVRGDAHTWQVGRLGDWKYNVCVEHKYFPSFLRRSAQLWFDSLGELAGFLIAEDGNDIGTILTLPSYDHLYGEMLQWALDNWRPRFGRLRIEVHEHQPWAMALLEQRGLRSQGIVGCTRAYDLAAQPDPAALPEGFSIVDMATNHDFVAKTALHTNAFRREDSVPDVYVWGYEYSRESPAYVAPMDLSVVAPDGRHVASCLALVDMVNWVADIERVCTHAAFRRLGLGRIVIRECMCRMQAQGYRRAYIGAGTGEAANGLYESLGPCDHKRWHCFEIA